MTETRSSGGAVSDLLFIALVVAFFAAAAGFAVACAGIVRGGTGTTGSGGSDQPAADQ
jgi:hypothetical protein